MNDNFNEQKDALLAIKHEISLLHQQVDFLLRNEKAVGLLDLDVMMNRTHTIYDRMCSINLESNPEEVDINEEEILDALSQYVAEEPAPAKEEPEEEEELSIEEEPEPEEELPMIEEEEPLMEENEDAYFEEEVEDVEEETPVEETPAEETPAEETPVEETPSDMPHNDVDDFGFILNFEPNDEEESPIEEEEAPAVYTTGDEIEMTVPQSLADKYQHDSLNDLRSAIGINDKFLLVNELFGGSMEKYNKSIDNLNDLKTLNGALVYMNELRVELQWNSNNEAYKRLLELVHRKFE
jgi:hypothetical protein